MCASQLNRIRNKGLDNNFIIDELLLTINVIVASYESNSFRLNV